MRLIRISIASLLVLAFVLCFCNMVPAATPAAAGGVGGTSLPGDGPSTIGSASYIPGEVIVKYASGVGRDGRASIMEAAGGAEVVNRIGPEGVTAAEVVKLRPGVPVEQAVAELESHDDVVYAEPNYLWHAAYTPNDPSYGEQYGFKNTGQVVKETAGTAGCDISAEDAWNIEQGFTNPPTVAIIDTGIDLTHPDLAAKILPNGYNYAGITNSSLNWSAPAGVYENWYFAQSIKGTGGQLTHIGIAAQKVGNPTGKLYVGICSGSLPIPPAAATNYFEILPSEVTTEGNEIYKALPTPVTLTAGATYYIEIATDNVDPGGTNCYNLFYNYGTLPGGNGPVYPDGSGWYYNSTQGWQQALWDDYYFRTNANAVPRDDQGHGTHCAGITAAITNNGTGVAGTCPGAGILPVKVLDTSGGGRTEDITSGIYYAADQGVDIISMSIQGPSSSQAAQDACTYAYNHGCTIFAAAGNNGTSSISYPAGYTSVVGVGATDNKDAKADFSQYNSSVDLTAPGVDIFATTPTYQVTATDNGTNLNYDFMSGTSMACPMAAGVGALVKSRFPTMTNLQIEQKMESTAKDLGAAGRDNNFGYGRVNAYRAVSSPPSISSLSAGSAYTGTTVTISGSDFTATEGTVYFGSCACPAADVTWTNNSISAKVPSSAYGGPIALKVRNTNGDSNTKTFYVAPRINTVSPSYGNAGVTVVTLTGTGFCPTRGTSSVWFGSSKATTYSSWSNTQIKVKVGAGAQGQAKVKVQASCCYSNAKAFDVRPVITSITPTTGPSGTQITISGSAFCNVQGSGLVCFGSTNVSTVVSWKQSQIKVNVPASVPAGAVQVKVYTLGGMSNYKVFTKT